MDMSMSNEENTAEMIRRAEEEIRRKATSDVAFVRCANFECLGVRGPDGVWRDTYGNVLDVVRIVSDI
jgi:hypothetical protein